MNPLRQVVRTETSKNPPPQKQRLGRHVGVLVPQSLVRLSEQRCTAEAGPTTQGAPARLCCFIASPPLVAGFTARNVAAVVARSGLLRSRCNGMPLTLCRGRLPTVQLLRSRNGFVNHNPGLRQHPLARQTAPT